MKSTALHFRFLCLALTALALWAGATASRAETPDDPGKLVQKTPDADPSQQELDNKSPDSHFGFRYSFAKGSEAEEQDRRPILAIHLVEAASGRVVLSWPKDALTPLHLGDMDRPWSKDSKHLTLNYQTSPRTWTTKLYEWNGKEFVELPFPRETMARRIAELQAAQLKALGLPEDTPRRLVHEGYTAEGWNEEDVRPNTVRVVVQRMDSVAVTNDQPPAELDARFRFFLKISEPGKIEIAKVEKLSLEGEVARLIDERPESSYLVTEVAKRQQPFRVYAMERFRILGEMDGDLLIQDDPRFPGETSANHRGTIPRRLVHVFPSSYSTASPYSTNEMVRCTESFGYNYDVLLKVAKSGSPSALRAFFALPEMDGAAGEGYDSDLNSFRDILSAKQLSDAVGPRYRLAFNPDWSKEPPHLPAVRQSPPPDFSAVMAKAVACGRLVDESLTAGLELTTVSDATKKFEIHGGEYFAIVSEDQDSYVIQDGAGHQGRIAKGLVEKTPKPETDAGLLLPMIGINYPRIVKGTQGPGHWCEKSLMLELDLTGPSGALHSHNLEEMLNSNDETVQQVLKDLPAARRKAVGAMLLQGRDEKDKARLMKKYRALFPGISATKHKG